MLNSHNYTVRPATTPDIPPIADLSSRVQARLTASGSLQVIGPIPLAVVAAEVAAGSAYLLCAEQQPVGSVFVSPLVAHHVAAVPRHALAPANQPLYFLHKLMVEPSLQGCGLGNRLVITAQTVTAQCGGGLVLDCWAGNGKLRAFYKAAGFRLHAVVSEEDYEIAVYVWP